MGQERRSIMLPVVLVLLGVILLHGCIYIPTFNKHYSGIDASNKVGDAKSRKPLRVGSATRADVEHVLGRPWHVSADATEIAYTWEVQNGVWLTLCFGSQEVKSRRALVLKFDGDTLRGFRVEKNLSRWIREKSAAPPEPTAGSPTSPLNKRPSAPSPSPTTAAPSTGPPPPPSGPTYKTEPKSSP